MELAHRFMALLAVLGAGSALLGMVGAPARGETFAGGCSSSAWVGSTHFQTVDGTYSRTSSVSGASHSGYDPSVVISWQMPVAPPIPVGRLFDPPNSPWVSGHRGVDICPGVGATIHAPADGTVVYAGEFFNRNLVSIRHANGVRSTFEPVSPVVAKNSFVQAGDVVGHLEAGHDSDCLHWGAKVNKYLYLNPLALILGEPILKPLDK
ncbi:M23 family metallopeptidase [Gleimia europaea]|uniref:M23 family metallopeptidase n=1 Tax=Gleimia europaea TaxID=66228 RepID=UPI000C810117|nr:M23 family metallopeptidase [Gleimia europaea]WIK63262.1 M23 family metallopeptidase [Gleimia europaea]